MSQNPGSQLCLRTCLTETSRVRADGELNTAIKNSTARVKKNGERSRKITAASPPTRWAAVRARLAHKSSRVQDYHPTNVFLERVEERTRNPHTGNGTRANIQLDDLSHQSGEGTHKDRPLELGNRDSIRKQRNVT